MTSAISNKSLLEKCKRYIMNDPNRSDMDLLVQDALITANREIADIGGAHPLAWNVERYSELFSRYYATISDITAANPGVITADSVDPNLTSDHGFQTGDICYLDGVNGSNTLHRLNGRLFRAVRTAATTLTLKALDGTTVIDTTDHEAYNSGGTIYHAGMVLPTTIVPAAGDAWLQWKIKRVFGATIDGYQCNPVSQERAVAMQVNRPGSRPCFWRYDQYAYGSFSSPDHILFWYPYVSQRYNLEVMIEKEYPDISSWSATAYPPHPNHIHDFIWHRALSNLATNAERQRRRSSGKEGEMGDNTRIEILNANYWIAKAMKEEIEILEHSRHLEGQQSYMSEGMGA